MIVNIIPNDINSAGKFKLNYLSKILVNKYFYLNIAQNQ